MKKVKIKQLLVFMFIMMMYVCFSSFIVYGDDPLLLFDDDGSTPGKWTFVEDYIDRATSLKNGPSRDSGLSGGSPGYFYVFRNSDDDTREMFDATIERTVYLTEVQKTLCRLGQLTINYSVDYHGWEDDNGDEDWFRVSLSKNGDSFSYDRYIDNSHSGPITGTKGWKRFTKTDIQLPKDTYSVTLNIYAERKSGSDLDVYLDNIKLWLSDENPPYIEEVTVTELRDRYDKVVPLKKGEDPDIYLDNWVDPEVTINGTIKFNEPVEILKGNHLMTNVQYEGGSMITGKVPDGLSDTHEFSINLSAAYKLMGEDNYIKFYYNPDGNGPFYRSVRDIGENKAIYNVKPNIDKYRIKLDNAIPRFITPQNSYKAFMPGRTSVDIVVREESRGFEQSPVILTYHWEYEDNNGKRIIEPEKRILISSTAEADDIYTTYTARIDIPNGSNIPPYQQFILAVGVTDEARDRKSFFGSDSMYYIVNQKDETPPTITWDKSIHIDGTEIDINSGNDTLYTTRRTVSFNVEDPDSGIEEVRYSWTREPYREGDSMNKVALPAGDGKYYVEGTSTDTPLEGIYYLNIMAINGTDTHGVSSKPFYFDNQGPRGFVSLTEEIGHGIDTLHYSIYDRDLQNKFLYTILKRDDDYWDFEPVTEPDISEGIKDSGMWHVMEIDITDGTTGSASITDMLNKIEGSGFYKVVARFYDGYYNWSQDEYYIVYDFDPPTIKVVELGEPEVFKKRHEVSSDFWPEYVFPGVVIEIEDTSYVNLWDEEFFSVKWVNVETGEEIPAEVSTMQGWVIISGNDSLSGRYYIRVYAKDHLENSMNEMVFMDGNTVEFCFDNSPPTVDIKYDKAFSTNKMKFIYSELEDKYTDVAAFRYGITSSPEEIPFEWTDIDAASSQGEVTSEVMEGTWYLHIYLEDTLGNEQTISFPEAFVIDMTKPEGSISFTSGYTNKLDTALKLEIEELKTTDKTTFKTILSDNMAMLEDEAIGELPASQWKNITFENGMAIYNWRPTNTDDGEKNVYARFMDVAGNISDIYSESIILDRTPPTGVVTYSVTEPTAGNVTVSLTMSDSNAVTLLNNNGNTSYVFNRNGEFEFVFMDAAGNKGRVKAEVDYIDKTPPKAYVTYSPLRDIWTNESITATLHLEDENEFVVLSEGGFTHTFNNNGEFVFEFEDNLGNKGSIKAEVKNIDKDPPIGNIIYVESDTAPVTVYLDTNEPVKVTNNDGSFRYVFYENGVFTFEFEDKAGNKGTITAEVDSISSAEKYLDIEYKDSGLLTKNNVTATFTPVTDKACITSPTVTEEVYGPDYIDYTFNENGDYTVYIRVFSEPDGENIRTVTASVYNIDRTSPEAYVYLSTTELTNENVTATLLTYDDRGKEIEIINNIGKSEYVFEENGTFTFQFEDEAGNIAYKEITVSNIDKDAPIAVITYYKEEGKPNSKFAKISFTGETDDVEILNNNGSDIFEFVENGSFTFRFSDKAGNTGEAIASADDLSDSISAGTIEYYIDGTRIDDPDEIMTNKSVTAKLVLDGAGGPYTIVNNGGSDSYTFEHNGEFTFIYEDKNSNRGFATAKVGIIDKEVPKLQILANTVRPTRENVIITVTYSDNVGVKNVSHNMEPEKITSTASGFTYICTDNKEISVTVTDAAGNSITKNFIVDYIDKEAPTGTITYTPNSITNRNVRAVLTLNEPAKILNNNGKAEYVFTQNGEFVFEFEDYAGNKGTITAVVDWIDRVVPKVSLEYSNTERTNKPVEVTVITEEGSIIINNGGSAKRTFYRNGEFTFMVRDLAGNIAEIKAEVKNIDAEPPALKLRGLSYVALFKDEAYTEEGFTASDNIDGDLTDDVIVEGSVDTATPGVYILKYTVFDAVGNITEVTRTVKVLSTDELVLLLNDEVVEGESMILNESEVKVGALGNEGKLRIKWDKGKRTQAYFKTSGQTAAQDETLWLQAYNWYTFFVQDQERRSKIIQVYVNGN
ncbi:MAG: DUF5011 domain-containing protein [Lutispora sp.]